MAVKGKLPDHVMVVAVETVLSHCPKCMIRSGLWQPEMWPDTGTLPTFAETLARISHTRFDGRPRTGFFESSTGFAQGIF